MKMEKMNDIKFKVIEPIIRHYLKDPLNFYYYTGDVDNLSVTDEIIEFLTLCFGEQVLIIKEYYSKHYVFVTNHNKLPNHIIPRVSIIKEYKNWINRNSLHESFSKLFLSKPPPWEISFKKSDLQVELLNELRDKGFTVVVDNIDPELESDPIIVNLKISIDDDEEEY